MGRRRVSVRVSVRVMMGRRVSVRVSLRVMSKFRLYV